MNFASIFVDSVGCRLTMHIDLPVFISFGWALMSSLDIHNARWRVQKLLPIDLKFLNWRWTIERRRELQVKHRWLALADQWPVDARACNLEHLYFINQVFHLCLFLQLWLLVENRWFVLALGLNLQRRRLAKTEHRLVSGLAQYIWPWLLALKIICLWCVFVVAEQSSDTALWWMWNQILDESRPSEKLLLAVLMLLFLVDSHFNV